MNQFTLVVRSGIGGVLTELDFLGRRPAGVASDLIVADEATGTYKGAIRQQIVLPRGFNGLLLPHPDYFAPRPVGTYTDLPAVIPSVVECDWHPEHLWLNCRIPEPNVEQIFYAGQPIAHFVPVPRGDVICNAMEVHDTALWERRRQHLAEHPEVSRKIKQFGWESVRV